MLYGNAAKPRIITYLKKGSKVMKQPIITISREFGSGGRQIGEQVAKALGLTSYDRTLVDIVAQKSGYSLEFVAENDQRVTNSMLFQIAISGSIPPWLNGGKDITNRDTLFSAQSKVIRELASQDGCVIVGRCANYVLRDVPEHSQCLSVASSMMRSSAALPNMAFIQTLPRPK